jgi:hypothetical protein
MVLPMTGRPKFLAPMLAPELTVPQKTVEDLPWVGAGKGVQPITNTNPDGDFPGVPFMTPTA